MFMKILDTRRLSAPAPGQYTCPLFSNFLSGKAKYQVSVYRISGPLISSSEPQAHRVSIQYRHDLASIRRPLVGIRSRSFTYQNGNLLFSETILPNFTKYCMRILGAGK